jgi:hypothetical protein
MGRKIYRNTKRKSKVSNRRNTNRRNTKRKNKVSKRRNTNRKNKVSKRRNRLLRNKSIGINFSGGSATTGVEYVMDEVVNFKMEGRVDLLVGKIVGGPVEATPLPESVREIRETPLAFRPGSMYSIQYSPFCVDCDVDGKNSNGDQFGVATVWVYADKIM